MEAATNTPKFPYYFPSNCPPTEAVSDAKELFRFCIGEVPAPEDFISFYLSNPEKYRENVRAYGLSVYGSLADCNAALRKSPKLRAKFCSISHGITDESIGKYMPTPSRFNPKHITWWVYDGIKPHTFFERCLEGSESDE